MSRREVTVRFGKRFSKFVYVGGADSILRLKTRLSYCARRLQQVVTLGCALYVTQATNTESKPAASIKTVHCNISDTAAAMRRLFVSTSYV